MKLKERLKAYIVGIIEEETVTLKNRIETQEEKVKNLDVLVENVQNLNATMEGYADLEENVRNLNAAVEGYEALAENVRNLNASVKGFEALAENVRYLNAAMEGYAALAENVRNLNATMENQEALAENVRNLNASMKDYEALAENVRNLNAAMKGYEALAENVRNLNASVKDYEALAENVRNLNATMEGYGALAENVQSLNVAMREYESLAENVRNLNVAMEGQEALAENVRNINRMLKNYEQIVAKLEAMHSALEMNKVKIAMLEKANKSKVHRNTMTEEDSLEERLNPSAEKRNLYIGINYFDFENHFRGSMENIKRNQQQYIRFYEGKSNVLDLGCGRGEFLDLLRENNIEAQGVDLYEEYVEMCRMNGLKVVQDDAIHFLRMQSKVGGIFCGQVIEHLIFDQIVELCKLAYEKLEDGAYIVMETPNPTSLAIYTDTFYVDPSHNKPVHPVTMKYILEKAGFLDINIIYTETSRLRDPIPALNGIENIEKFNNAMRMVSEMLFGSLDYAIIARKTGGLIKDE